MNGLNGSTPNGASMNGSHVNGEPATVGGLAPWPPRSFDDHVDQREQLERELSVSQSRTDAARRRAADRDESLKAALRDELIASRERLAEMDRLHDERITAIRSAADEEITRIIASARAELEHEG